MLACCMCLHAAPQPGPAPGPEPQPDPYLATVGYRYLLPSTPYMSYARSWYPSYGYASYWQKIGHFIEETPPINGLTLRQPQRKDLTNQTKENSIEFNILNEFVCFNLQNGICFTLGIFGNNFCLVHMKEKLNKKKNSKAAVDVILI